MIDKLTPDAKLPVSFCQFCEVPAGAIDTYGSQTCGSISTAWPVQPKKIVHKIVGRRIAACCV